MARTIQRLEDVPKPTHAEWLKLGEEVDKSFLETLRSLSEEEWAAPTECSPWTVKDMMAHILGWAEATMSPRELTRQTIAGFKTKGAHGGVWLDATNQSQIDTRAPMSIDEVIARFVEITPGYHKTRTRYGLMTGLFPMKEPFSGTWVPMRFLFDTIFVRDHFMHHVDICTATGRMMPVGDAEIRIAHDAFREWSDKAKASVTLELSGPAGGTFTRGTGETSISGDAIDLCRVLAGRRCDKFEVDGDEEAAKRWLSVLAAF
ncbi:MAG: hypothetical protein QOG04_2153 [Actinomycetota bacterium]|jgi:uncharacterized protein (TIGR03083 family)|nr:hypothetical protein [Actinomycetota bacterium]